jgi:hypothetical protein
MIDTAVDHDLPPIRPTVILRAFQARKLLRPVYMKIGIVQDVFHTISRLNFNKKLTNAHVEYGSRKWD